MQSADPLRLRGPSAVSFSRFASPTFTFIPSLVHFCSTITLLCLNLCSFAISLSLLRAPPQNVKPLPVSEGVTTIKELGGCCAAGGVNGRWSMYKYHHLTKPPITTRPHKAAFLVTETDFDINACMWPVLIPTVTLQHERAGLSFSCPTEAEHSLRSELISALSPVGSDGRSCPGCRMLMRIILQVRERRSDVATRQSNGFFVV